MLGDEIKLKCAHHYDYELLSLILKGWTNLGLSIVKKKSIVDRQSPKNG